MVLDAHTNLITASSITDYYQAPHFKLGVVGNEIMFSLQFKGFEAIIDTKQNFPMTTRKKVLIRPGHLVHQV